MAQGIERERERERVHYQRHNKQFEQAILNIEKADNRANIIGHWRIATHR